MSCLAHHQIETEIRLDMKAAVFHGARNIHVEEVQEPEIADDEVLLQVEWCGLCGTDLHEYLMGIH